MRSNSLSLGKILLSGIVGLAAISTARAADYTIDKVHSNVGFEVRHIVSHVRGRFGDFAGTFSYDPAAPETSVVQATIQIQSIDTGEPKRDNHLRSADFFDATKFPEMTYTSSKVTKVSDTELKVDGTLVLHGVSKPVSLDVTLGGIAKDPWGNTRAGFTATTKINRKDFGINWNKTLDNGGLMVGDDVAIEIDVEGVQKK